jgi:hypothetical protein
MSKSVLIYKLSQFFICANISSCLLYILIWLI